MKKHILLSCCFIFYTLVILAQNQPNIILVLVDDQGWTGTSLQMKNGLSTSKSDYYQTPNLERLAQNGMTFSQGYAPAAKCAPTRHGILTGQSPAKTKRTTTGNGTTTGRILVPPTITSSIDPNLTTFPELIKQINSNYWTAHFGKWHLGGNNNAPDFNGFDRHDGANGNSAGDASNGLSIQTDPKKIFTLTDSAMNFMEEAVNSNHPFYLQVSHYAVHTLLESTQSMFNIYSDPMLRPAGTNHNDTLYGAMTEDLDVGLGMLLDKVDALGITNNTYIIYISDNGAQTGLSNNVPLSNGKVYLKEGGIRVPFVITGPNVLANSYSDVAVNGYDFYPTIIEWIDGNTNNVPSDVEGSSLVATLANGTATPNRSVPMIFHSPHYDTNQGKRPSSAIVEDNYKFYVNYETGSFELYDLDNDISESNNLFITLPAIADDLCLKLRDYLKSVSADMPALDETHADFTGTGTDVDADGLDDTWELRELLTYHYDGSDDPDGDGLTNAQEFADGTDPYQNSVNTQSQLNNYSFYIFPNPVQNQLTITSTNVYQNVEIHVSDMLGKTINVYPFENTSSLQVNTSDFPKGLFVVEIRTRTGLTLNVKKLMKL